MAKKKDAEKQDAGGNAAKRKDAQRKGAKRKDDWVLSLDDARARETARVGGKNASLAEMIQELAEAGVRVPDGFATTAAAYRAFLAHNGIEEDLASAMKAYRSGDVPLEDAAATARACFEEGSFPPDVEADIVEAYAVLARETGVETLSVAVRSSATAEDLPSASFAGQQESFLSIRGEEALLDACRSCYASLFTARAVAYREENDFEHLDVALSVGVQRMVRSDLGGAGVMFSLDTETGFPDLVLIDAAFGFGETVVQGTVDPDEYLVFKPLLDAEARPIVAKRRGEKARMRVAADSEDAEEPTREVETPEEDRERFVLDDDAILQLARWAARIEAHYDRPMDMEWAQDGETGELFVVQARPETVHSQRSGAWIDAWSLEGEGKRLVEGVSVGAAVAQGNVRVLESPEDDGGFEDGDVLVTRMTDPDWMPLLRRAGAVVTEHGGRTSHAAIVSRELGLPAVVGTGDARDRLSDGATVTVSCAEGEAGYVYEGEVPFEHRRLGLEDIPETRTQVMLNLGDPKAALRWWRLPADGVGLARVEFIVANAIRAHPMALANLDVVEDDDVRAEIEALARGYPDLETFFVEVLSRAIGLIAASRHPHPVLVRLSDFKTNEYADLLGGRWFEPEEENPMLGWRGASRYVDEAYADGFRLECAALRRAREEMGFANVVPMVPFCRTPQEADRVLAALAEHGLVRGRAGLEVYAMAEIPSNALLAEDFAERFDGFSIGTNDLTQLVLGVDRDSSRLAHLFDAQDPAVVKAIRMIIEGAHARGRKVGLCGQAPSDHPAFARVLVEAGIDALSVSPDSFLAVKEHVAAAEAEVPEAAGRKA